MSKLRILQIFILMLLCNMFVSCKKDTNITGECKIQSFIVTVNGQQIEGQINEEDTTITISGVTGATSITAVSYQLSEGNTIYPTPESRIGDWRKDEKFKVSLSSMYRTYAIVLPDYVEGGEAIGDYTGWITDKSATIDVNDKFGSISKYFFYDLKGWPSSISNIDKAVDFFVNDGMDGIRIPIYGNYYEQNVNSGIQGHPEQGKVDPAGYETVLKSINFAKMVKPDLIIFASKKLNGNFSFPAWAKDNNGVKVNEYSELIIDFLKYMKSNNIEVDILGVDNEINFNEGNITAEKYNNIVNRVKERINQEGLRMPKFIGPERYVPQGYTSNTWLHNIYDKGYQNNLDIYGTHYYPADHNYTEFNRLKTEVEKIKSEGLEFWATEPHWDTAEKYEEDLMSAARLAICALWDQTDLGMDAYMWWNYKNSGDLRGCLMRAISVPLHFSQPIRMTDHDGVEMLDNKQNVGMTDPDADPVFNTRLHSRAFIKGNEVNVYVVNVRLKSEAEEGISYKGYNFNIQNGSIDGDIEFTQWTDESAIEGNKGIVKPISESEFSMDIPSRSITHFSFKIK